ncbi:hypothetical protein C0993_002512 [Termitomyces sp. T159_Od127]|nr:hypothetical protein C0993_002512 [Termitomyces sp. T159_Od127]
MTVFEKSANALLSRFYSWRRYCNKHQIRLGGYVMNLDRSESPILEDDQEIEEESMIHSGPGAPISAPSQRTDPNLTRNRSPTPPRALFRSTTGKGVAFTDEDVTFLRRFMEYRKYVKVFSSPVLPDEKGMDDCGTVMLILVSLRSQGRLDMVVFWKDVATKVRSMWFISGNIIL